MTTTDILEESLVREAHRQLLEQGYCKFSNVLSSAMLHKLRDVTARLLQQRATERAGQITTGSMIPTSADPAFSELIAFAPTLAILQALGYARPTFTDGYVISKPPFGPPLFWHYDWFAWETPQAPPQPCCRYLPFQPCSGRASEKPLLPRTVPSIWQTGEFPGVNVASAADWIVAGASWMWEKSCWCIALQRAAGSAWAATELAIVTATARREGVLF